MDWNYIVTSILTTLLIAEIGRYGPKLISNFKGISHIEAKIDSLSDKVSSLSADIAKEKEIRELHETLYDSQEIINSRISLIKEHSRLYEKNCASYDEKKNFEDLYNNYEALIALTGQTNGVMQRYYNEVKALPNCTSQLKGTCYVR